MINILCISDIHISDFRNYNFYPNFRLEQFDRLASRLLEIAGQYSCIDTLIIAGDLADNAVQNPQELHTIHKFLKKLATRFTKIYYIVGQHDTFVRSSPDTGLESFSFSTFTDCNLEYVHDQFRTIHDRIFYFRSFETTDTVEVPKCDVFIGHVTLSDNQLYGQKLAGNFKIAICGDIHKPIDIGNAHSIGSPLQKSLNDEPYGTVGILEIDSLTFNRVQVISPNYKFLRIYRKGTEVNPDEYTVIRDDLDKTIDTNIRFNGSLVNISNGVQSLIDSNIPKELTGIHKQYKNRVNFDSDIDLDFSINKLSIINFRSIDQQVIKFPNGVTFIKGNNGSGKSTILTALRTVLLGDKYIKKNLRIDTSNCEVSIDLTWRCNNYLIVRGSGYTKFFVNGTLSNVNTKTHTEEYIYNTLPFLKYIDLFFLKSSEGNFASKFVKSNLLQSVFKFDSLEQFSELADADIKSTKKSIKTVESDIDRLKGGISSLEKSIESENLGEEPKVDVRKLQAEIADCRAKIAEYDRLTRDKSHLTSLLSSKVDKPESDGVEETKLLEKWDNLSSLKSKLNKLIRSKNSDIECPNCHHKFNLDIELIQRIAQVEKEVGDLESQLATAKSAADCSRVLSQIRNYNNWIESNKRITKQLEDLDGQLTRYSGIDFDQLHKTIETNEQLISEYDRYQYKKQSIENRAKELRRLTDRLISKNAELTALSTYRTELERYKYIFDRSNENSLYAKIVELITKVLTDEVIKCHIDLGKIYFSYNNGSSWIAYEACSDGQKILIDLHLIRKMTSLLNTRVGLLVLDEVGAQLDSGNFIEYNNLLMSLDIPKILVTSHSGFLKDYNNKIELFLDNGITRIA